MNLWLYQGFNKELGLSGMLLLVSASPGHLSPFGAGAWIWWECGGWKHHPQGANTLKRAAGWWEFMHWWWELYSAWIAAGGCWRQSTGCWKAQPNRECEDEKCQRGISAQLKKTKLPLSALFKSAIMQKSFYVPLKFSQFCSKQSCPLTGSVNTPKRQELKWI